jgi:predicted aldo/keto reductase-like oxidoreductase
MNLDRRSFLQLSAAATAAAALGHSAHAAETVNGMPYRRLGKTNENVSLLGVGGYHIGHRDVTDEQAIAMMRHAVDEGVNFFDNAWEYNDGRSEELMGKALKDGYRDRVFLMTKIVDRTREGAQAQLDDCLRRLNVDHVDLLQIHSVKDPEDAHVIYTDGALDVAIKAREAGKVRFIGFTGHVNPKGHAEVLNGDFDWATVQMPLSVMDHHYLSFAANIIPVVQQRDMGIIAMKTLGGNAAFLRDGTLTPAEALRYAMNLPVSTVVSGMVDMAQFKENITIAKACTPYEPGELDALLAKVAPVADGRYERFKVELA